MARSLKNAVVVITGASSGIGRATALKFAEEGARVVLASRNEEALERLADSLESMGCEAVAVATDVSNERSVRHLADTAYKNFGRIDVWVNNAGVYLLGEVQDVPMSDIHQLMEINFFGVVHGCREALRYMKKKNRGTIINTASVDGKVGARYATIYAASKHAVVGFSQSLRQDLLKTNIDCCTVMPASIDTPLFQHSANYTGKAIKAMSPIYAPEDVADTIVGLAQNPKPEATVGNAAKVFTKFRHVAPAAFDKTFAKQVEKDHFEKRSASRSSGNLYQPDTDSVSISGGWRARSGEPLERRSSSRSDGGSSGIGLLPLLAIAGGAAAWYWRSRSGDHPAQDLPGYSSNPANEEAAS